MPKICIVFDRFIQIRQIYIKIDCITNYKYIALLHTHVSYDKNNVKLTKHEVLSEIH